MARKIEFNCKGDDKKHKCHNQVVYPKGVIVAKAFGESEKNVAPGKIIQTYLTCSADHCKPYDIVEFYCKKPGCKEVIVCTTEKAPVYQGTRHVERRQEANLTCDMGHPGSYEVLL
jgi:hypothetical protein